MSNEAVQSQEYLIDSVRVNSRFNVHVTSEKIILENKRILFPRRTYIYKNQITNYGIIDETEKELLEVNDASLLFNIQQGTDKKTLIKFPLVIKRWNTEVNNNTRIEFVNKKVNYLTAAIDKMFNR